MGNWLQPPRNFLNWSYRPRFANGRLGSSDVSLAAGPRSAVSARKRLLTPDFRHSLVGGGRADDERVTTCATMAKGKSNPKTLEHVKRMTKQMRSEQAEATALEAATQAAQAVDRKKKTRKGRRGDVSSDDDLDDDPAVAQAANNGGKKGTGSQSKVQVAGFGIGCRGTGNEKARKLKE